MELYNVFNMPLSTDNERRKVQEKLLHGEELTLQHADDPSDKEDKLMGYTDTMKLVNVNGNCENIGKIVNVKINEIKTWSMDGEIVNDWVSIWDN